MTGISSNFVLVPRELLIEVIADAQDALDVAESEGITLVGADTRLTTLRAVLEARKRN